MTSGDTEREKRFKYIYDGQTLQRLTVRVGTAAGKIVLQPRHAARDKLSTYTEYASCARTAGGDGRAFYEQKDGWRAKEKNGPSCDVFLAM